MADYKVCPLGKYSQPFFKQGSRAEGVFDVMYLTSAGRLRPNCLGEAAMYYLVFVDDKPRRMKTCFLKSKSETEVIRIF